MYVLRVCGAWNACLCTHVSEGDECKCSICVYVCKFMCVHLCVCVYGVGVGRLCVGM